MGLHETVFDDQSSVEKGESGSGRHGSGILSNAGEDNSMERAVGVEVNGSLGPAEIEREINLRNGSFAEILPKMHLKVSDRLKPI